MVRADLPRGVQAAQIAHAAGESSPGGLPSGTHVVVLTVPNEASLRGTSQRLLRANIGHVVIEEPDAPFSGALMALGVVPGRKEAIRRHLSSLPLLR